MLLPSTMDANGSPRATLPREFANSYTQTLGRPCNRHQHGYMQAIKIEVT